MARDFITECDPALLWLLLYRLEGFDTEADFLYTLPELAQDRCTGTATLNLPHGTV